MSLARRLGGPGIRRSIRGAGARASVAAADLAEQIVAAYTAASWVTVDLFLARADDVSLVDTDRVATWVNHGTAGDATQSTGTARPTWSETSLNSLPGLTFNGSNLLSRAAIDLSAYTALVHHVLFLDTTAAGQIVIERSTNAPTTNGGSYITVNEGAGTVRMFGRASNANTLADSTAQSMAAPHVVTGTWDQALATNECSVRIDGADATASRSSNSNTSGGLGNHGLFIGARSGIAAGLTGTIAAVVTAVGTTAIPTAKVAAVEALLASEWGL